MIAGSSSGKSISHWPPPGSHQQSWACDVGNELTFPNLSALLKNPDREHAMAFVHLVSVRAAGNDGVAVVTRNEETITWLVEISSSGSNTLTFWRKSQVHRVPHRP